MSYSTQMIEAIQSEKLDLASELLRQAIDMDNDEDLYALIETLYDLGFKRNKRSCYRTYHATP